MKKFRLITMTAALVLGLTAVFASKYEVLTANHDAVYGSGDGYFIEDLDCQYIDYCPGGSVICKGLDAGTSVTLMEGYYSNGSCGVLLGML